MKIQIHKFGSILTSRESGKEAFGAFHPTIAALPSTEPIEIDFTGIGTLSPSWADEFISKIQDIYGDRVTLLPTENLSAKTTIKLLESIRNKTFPK